MRITCFDDHTKYDSLKYEWLDETKTEIEDLKKIIKGV